MNDFFFAMWRNMSFRNGALNFRRIIRVNFLIVCTMRVLRNERIQSVNVCAMRVFFLHWKKCVINRCGCYFKFKIKFVASHSFLTLLRNFHLYVSFERRMAELKPR